MWSYRHQSFTVHQLPALQDNYIYLIEEHNSNRLLAVDPAEAVSVRKASKELGKPVTHILVTHHHWDHTDGIKALKRDYGSIVVGATIDADRIPSIDLPVEEGSGLKPGDLDIAMLFVPGHTRGHLAYLIGDALFCGDTLFGAGCGRVFEGTHEQMWNSLAKLSQLPGETKIYCAHEYTLANLRFAAMIDPDNGELAHRIETDRARVAKGIPTIPSTIAVEIATNPFLRPLDAAFTAGYSSQNGIASDALSVFTDIRKRKDRF